MSDETLTMIPGPTPVHDRILGELARPTVSHVAPDFVASYRGLLDNVKKIGRTSHAHPFVVAGAGTLAMEMALVNMVAPGERVLIVSQGFFGDRFAQLAEAFGIEATVERAEWGQVVSPERLAELVESESYRAVTMTHVDTSTGAAAPIREYCEVLEGREPPRLDRRALLGR